MPLAASRPATGKDPSSRDRTYDAAAITTTAVPGHGASPARRAPPTAMVARSTASVAAADDTASAPLGLVMA